MDMASTLVTDPVVRGPRYTFPMTTTRPTKTRLTRRGRLLLLGILVALTFAVFSLGRVSGHAETPATSTATSYVTHVVAPGDTLWSIARAAHPGADPRAYVQRIVELNSLATSDVHVGQVIALPH